MRRSGAPGPGRRRRRRAASATFHLRIDLDDWAKEDEGLVHQVAAEIEQHAAAGFRRRDLPPGLAFGESRSPALESRLVPQHLAQLSLVQQATQGELIGVPAAIHENGEEDSKSLRLLHQRPGPGHGRGERLVDHHRQTGVERSAGQVDVGVVGRGHHHEVVLRGALEDLGRIGDHLGIRIRLRRLGLPFGVAGHHGAHRQTRCGGDQGSVEDRARQPVSDHGPSQLSHPLVQDQRPVNWRTTPRPRVSGWVTSVWSRPVRLSGSRADTELAEHGQLVEVDALAEQPVAVEHEDGEDRQLELPARRRQAAEGALVGAANRLPRPAPHRRRGGARAARCAGRGRRGASPRSSRITSSGPS